MEILRSADLSKQQRVSVETNLLRANNAIDILRTYVLSQIKGEVHWTLVGIGLENTDEILRCPVVPYQIAAFFEGIQRPYKATLIDIEEPILKDISQRTHIHVNQGVLPENHKDAWNLYLQRTGSKDINIYSNDSNIRFVPRARLQQITDAYTSGIASAPIPKSFITNDTVELILGNIGSRSLRMPRFLNHFVDIRNVMYLLNECQAKQALKNLNIMTVEHGLVLMNDIHDSYMGGSIVNNNRSKGLITQTQLKQEFGFELVLQQDTPRSSIYLLQKVLN